MKNVLLFLMIMILLMSKAVNAENDKSILDMIAEITDEQTIPEENSEDGFDNNVTASKEGSITVMIYLCGSTLEELTGSATKDIIEMINSDYNPEKVNVVIMAGGSRKWANRQIPDGTTGVYYLIGDKFHTLFNDGKAYNMGDPTTLSRFLTVVEENFQTEHYALIIWDHGGGSINGICQDENFEGDSLTMAELDTAFLASPFTGRKLDWIGFDACLMSTAETAKVIAPYANYMIASEETEPADGWNYVFLKGLEKDVSTEETGKRIIESYNYSVKQKYNTDNEYYMSCINLNKIGELVDSIDDFFEDFDITSENYAEMSRARRKVISFGRDVNSMNDPDLVDLGNMIKFFSEFGDTKKAEKVLKTIMDTVTDYTPQSCGATGLSVYFPFNNKYAYSKFMEVYNTIDFSDPYNEFISTFGQYLISSGNNTWSVLSTIHDVTGRVIHSRFKIDLTEEQVANFGDASLVALQKSPEAETWQLVGIQNAGIENDHFLTGEYEHKNLFFADLLDEPLHHVAIIFEDMGDGLIRFPVTLIDEQNNEFDAIMVTHGNLKDGITYFPEQFALEDGIDFYLFDEAINGYSPRLTADLTQFSSIRYMVYEKEMTYEDEALLSFDQWNVINTVSFELPLDKQWKLILLEDELDTESLYIAFRVTDIYNNVFMSEPTKLVGGSIPGLAIETVYDDQNSAIIDNEKFSAQDRRISCRIINISDKEMIIFVDNFTVNDVSVDSEVEIFGTGPGWGLVPNESQLMSVVLPWDNGENITKITYDMTFYDPDGEVIGVIPVTHAIIQ